MGLGAQVTSRCGSVRESVNHPAMTRVQSRRTSAPRFQTFWLAFYLVINSHGPLDAQASKTHFHTSHH